MTTRTSSLHIAPEGRTRVTKKLAPTQHGAMKLARRFGPGLVCVRYRVDERQQLRYTTVELVVDMAALRPGRTAAAHEDEHTVMASEAEVGLQDNRRMRALAIALGARWDGKARVWHIPGRYAHLLLRHRPVAPTPSDRRRK
jgi:hypothetical protein